MTRPAVKPFPAPPEPPEPGDWDSFWQNSVLTEKPSWSKRRICRILQNQIRPGMRVLDAGSGSGFFSAWFLKQDCRTTALDFSESALELTRRTTQGMCGAYIKDDITDSEMPGRMAQKFDIIFSDGLFEHFEPEKQDAIVKNMAHLLEPGGLIVTFVPNLWTPWTLLRPFLMKGIDEKPFTIGSLRELYERNSFRITSCGGINCLPIKYSPDSLLGSRFGMLVYCIGLPK